MNVRDPRAAQQRERELTIEDLPPLRKFKVVRKQHPEGSTETIEVEAMGFSMENGIAIFSRMWIWNNAPMQGTFRAIGGTILDVIEEIAYQPIGNIITH